MNPRWAFFLTITGLVMVAVVLVLLFPAVFEFVKGFTGELRFFWWIVLLAGLAVWLFFGVGRSKK